MTKPITSVAAMMLYEEGAFELKDPIARFIPRSPTRACYRRLASRRSTEPQTEPIRIWHLLTHTSGLTYGFHHAHPVDAMYRGAGFEWGHPPGLDLAACCDAWAALPLLFQPGSGVELLRVDRRARPRGRGGRPGSRSTSSSRERIFEPLGHDRDRLLASERTEPTGWPRCTSPRPGDGRGRSASTPWAAHATRRPTCCRGGGGLVGTAADYPRFAHMLLGRRRARRRPAARHRAPSTT